MSLARVCACTTARVCMQDAYAYVCAHCAGIRTQTRSHQTHAHRKERASVCAGMSCIQAHTHGKVGAWVACVQVCVRVCGQVSTPACVHMRMDRWCSWCMHPPTHACVPGRRHTTTHARSVTHTFEYTLARMQPTHRPHMRMCTHAFTHAHMHAARTLTPSLACSLTCTLARKCPHPLTYPAACVCMQKCRYTCSLTRTLISALAHARMCRHRRW